LFVSITATCACACLALASVITTTLGFLDPQLQHPEKTFNFGFGVAFVAGSPFGLI